MASAGLSNLNGINSAGSGVLDQRLSLDVQGVDALRRTVRSSPQEGMKQASKQFEVMFLQMMLKSMRDATPSDGMFSSSQEKTYTSMLDQQLSQKLSGRGLGLAEAMFKQLSRTMGGNAAELPPASGGGGQMPGAFPLGTPLVTPALTRAPDLSFYEKATAQATMSRSVLPQAHVEQFVSRMLPAAQQASQASGVPVSSMPMPPRPSVRPEIAANRSAGKWRAINTVHDRKAGAQPMPISTCPATSIGKVVASADSAEPAMATGNAVSTVRRTPCRSMPMPMNSCIAPNAKWKAPANTPSTRPIADALKPRS